MVAVSSSYGSSSRVLSLGWMGGRPGRISCIIEIQIWEWPIFRYIGVCTWNRYWSSVNCFLARNFDILIDCRLPTSRQEGGHEEQLRSFWKQPGRSSKVIVNSVPCSFSFGSWNCNSANFCTAGERQSAEKSCQARALNWIELNDEAKSKMMVMA